MSHYHVCVWIDHQHARIFGIGLDAADVEVIADDGPVHHIHRKADHVKMGTEPMDHGFLNEIAAALQPAKAILICGPGRARSDLAGFLHEEFPAIAKRIWAIQPADHPTDAQLIASARAFFRSADKMRA